MAGIGGGESETIVMGVKPGAQSKELFTWCLVNVVSPGDCVIALHVIGNNDTVDQDGKALLFAMVREFDSLLSMYEGFCNFNQVDLKLKICRGSSIGEILVREAKSCSASMLILGGEASKICRIRPSNSVAKYCAKKLAKECSVLAVLNDKIIFHKEASPPSAKIDCSRGVNNHWHKGTACRVIPQLSYASKPINVELYENLEREVIVKPSSDPDRLSLKENCSICKPELAAGRQPEKKQELGSAKNVSGKEDWSHNLPGWPLQRKTFLSAIQEDSDPLLARNSSLVRLGMGYPDTDTNPQAENIEEGSAKIIIQEDPKTTVPIEMNISTKQVTDGPCERLGWPLLQVRRRLSEILNDPEPCSPWYLSTVDLCGMQLPSSETKFDSDSSTTNLRNSSDEKRGISNLEGVSNAIIPFDTKNIHVPQQCDDTTRSPVWKDLHKRYSSSCRLFSYEELRMATSDSAPENLIGKGGNSKVYRGVLADNKKKVAVKILNPSEDAMREFILEIEIITSLHHKNIISLFGFCYEDNHLLLVYDLLRRGSLEENLLGNKKDPSAFGWNERYKVAVGVAEAIKYLHNLSNPPVIHRDVKSSNILLSDDFEPQLSDFGLAKWASSSSLASFTDIAGTFGYMAPEYFMYGKVTEKIDVYAYGVVLLELLSGKKPISNDHPPKGRESLVMWARPILDEGKFVSMLDPSLGSNYNLDQMERMVLTANLCIRQSPQTRPNIDLVLKLLKGDTEAIRWARLQTNATDRVCDGENDPSPSASSSIIKSHLNLAFLALMEDDSLSLCSVEHNYSSIEEYLRGRCSRTSSFD